MKNDPFTLEFQRLYEDWAVNEQWMHGEQTMNALWMMWTVGEWWMQNCEWKVHGEQMVRKTVNGEQTVNARWTHEESTANEWGAKEKL